MKAIQILIVEDDVQIGQEIHHHLNEFGYEVAGIARSGQTAIDLFREKKPDLVLMDIELEGKMDGIDTAKAIFKITPVPIIYVTGVEDDQIFKRAQEATPNTPAAYIDKPIRAITLYRQMELAIQRNKEKGQLLSDSLFIKERDRYMRVKIETIDYIEADRNYCHIYLTQTRKLTVNVTLNEFMNTYPHPSIVRIHRSRAINFEKVEYLQDNYVNVAGINLAIGPSFFPDIRDRLNIVR